MLVEFRCKSDYKNSLELRNLFPQISKSLQNGKTLFEISQLILSSEKSQRNFQQYSAKTLTKFIKGSLIGGHFRNLSFEGSMEEPLEYFEIINHRKPKKGLEKLIAKKVISPWREDEITFIIAQFENKLNPREIYQRFNQENQFKKIEYKTFESKYWDLKKAGKVKTSFRINWDLEIGDWAIYFKKRYGTYYNSSNEYAHALNEYFFNSKQIVTRSKLTNFYKREESRQNL